MCIRDRLITNASRDIKASSVRAIDKIKLSKEDRMQADSTNVFCVEAVEAVT